MLKYKDHSYDPQCDCCVITDEAPAIDPTGTEAIRGRYAQTLEMAWRQFGAALHQLIVKHDVIGLASDALTNALLIARQGYDPAARLEGFGKAAGSLLSRIVLVTNRSKAIPIVRASYGKGARFALSQIEGRGKTSPAGLNTQQLALKRAGEELAGIGAAVIQQISRRAAAAIASGESPDVVSTSAYGIIQKVGMARSRLLAEDIVVGTFTAASLDTYEANGIEFLGMVAEEIDPKRLDDAKRKTQKKERKGAGSRSSRKQTPSRSTIYRIRKQEEKVEKLQKVYVRTRGDNKVCPICKAIAKKGPYTINRARQLIPAHPRCRCVFIPANDKRFKRNKGQE